jgi:prephenate dehydratase
LRTALVRFFFVLLGTNVSGGSIHSNYDHILRFSDLFIVGETNFRVQHCLMSLPSTPLESVTKVIRWV